MKQDSRPLRLIRSLGEEIVDLYWGHADLERWGAQDSHRASDSMFWADGEDHHRSRRRLERRADLIRGESPIRTHV